MRFVLALFKHETNTFSPTRTGMTSFSRGSTNEGPCYGEDAIKANRGTNNAVAAFLDLATELNAEADFVVSANAVPSGLVTKEAFDNIVAPIVESVRAGCDAVLLDLHGAMVSEGYADAEGELLRRLRAIDPDVPIIVALDFHANLSEDFIRLATVITGYCTYPHIDVYQTGERAARTLKRILLDQARPVVLWRRLPMLTQILRQSPSMEPMKTIMDAAIAAETNGVVLNASVFGGFPLADIPHVGLSIVLVAEPSQLVNAQALLDTLTRMAWERREDFMCDFDSFGSSIAYAHKLDSFPIVLADHGDNCASGGTTDNMEVLREVLKQGLQEVIAGPFWDPGAVDQLIGLGVGGQCTIDIGGKTDVPALGERGIPLSVSATVIAITDGVYTVTGPMFTGMRLSLGRTVLIDIGAAQIVLSEKPQEPFDLGVFTHAGVDPASKRYILIKSKQHFRAGFEPIAKHVVMIAGPGVCSSDFSRFPYQHLSRPIFPLDLHVACTDGDQWLPSQQHQ